MSPEQINEVGYNEMSDIWSAGCLIYELAALKPPFEATNTIQLALKIRESQVPILPNKYSPELNRVIKWMLSKNKRDRPSVEDLMNVPELSFKGK